MRRIYITFGGQVYDSTTALITLLAPRFGADEVRVYDDHWLTTDRRDFREEHRWLWDHPHKRGFGWYVWKPLVILDALKQAEDGDIVLYTDADTFPVHDLGVLYETCAKDGGIMLFKAGGNVNQRFRQEQWCKRDCFIVMNQDEERYHQAEAGVARFMLFQKGREQAQRFLEEWLAYCVNPRATTFDPSVFGPELPGFVEHRTEQAIMTNLAHRNGLRLYREACELGIPFPEDQELFPQMFSQVNPWNNTTAPCAGSRFRNVGSAAAARPDFTAEDAMAACRIAFAEAEAKQNAIAEIILQATAERRPDCAAAYFVLAQLKEAAGDDRAALDLYDRAIAADPREVAMKVRRGIVAARI